MARKKGVDYSTRPWKEIRRRFETGQAGSKALSELYNIPETTIRTRASRDNWTGGRYAKRPKLQQIVTDCNSMQQVATLPDTSGNNKGAALWVPDRVEKLISDLADWLDSWNSETEEKGVTITAFCKSKYNTLQARPSQITYLRDNQLFMEGMSRLRPLIADRIATLTWDMKKSAPMGIFWLKQFGWTDRQEITTIDAGASIDAAISRAYDVTPKK